LKSLSLICRGSEGAPSACLELSLCDNVGGSRVYKVVGDACTQLKHFRLSKHSFGPGILEWWQNVDKDVPGNHLG
jgi:hypothetical protein